MPDRLSWHEWGAPLALLVAVHVAALGWLLARLAKPPSPPPCTKDE